MNELENIDNINIDDLYNKIVDRIEKAKRNVAFMVILKMEKWEKEKRRLRHFFSR